MLNKQISIKEEFKLQRFNDKLELKVMDGDYKSKIEVKDIVKDYAIRVYLKEWAINITDEQTVEYIVHYFNLIKQDVYIISVKNTGMKINHQ